MYKQHKQQGGLKGKSFDDSTLGNEVIKQIRISSGFYSDVPTQVITSIQVCLVRVL